MPLNRFLLYRRIVKQSKRIVKDTSSVLCELTEEDTKHLLTDVHQPYGTEINDILLSALGLTMKEWTKGAKIGINLEGHGTGRTSSRM
nr:condensation domain-containing protein [Bacillus subtilis]